MTNKRRICIAWNWFVNIWNEGTWLCRTCPTCHRVGRVSTYGRGAEKFITSAKWECMNCEANTYAAQTGWLARWVTE